MKIDLGYTEEKHPEHDFWLRQGAFSDRADGEEREVRTAYPSVCFSELDAGAMHVPDKGNATVKFEVTERHYSESKDESGKKVRRVNLVVDLLTFNPETSNDPLKVTARDAVDRWSKP